jgi:hypothetical protein
MTSTQRGGLAGAIGGVIVAAALFVDYGPGANLHQVARWFGVDFGAAGLALGAVILALFGALFGALFSRAASRWGAVTLGRAVLAGVVTGIVWWIIVPVLFGSVVRQQPVSLYGMLFFLALALLYGVVLGNVFVTLQERAG